MKSKPYSNLNANSLNTDTLVKKYMILKHLGEGGYSDVYLIKDIFTNEKYALKILKKLSPDFMNEIELYKKISQLKGANIIRLIAFGEQNFILNNNVERKQYMILDYAEKGQLFDYIYKLKVPFKEKHAKVIFYKILKTVKVMHDNHICHRDLKAENIVLDGNFNPKICDFGLSIKINPKINKGKIKSKVGTNHYKAPEIWKEEIHDSCKADIFSLGVILINLITCKYGFLLAISSDDFYKFILNKKYEIYWETIGEQIDINNLSQEFKDLYLKMVQYEQKDRIKSIKHIMEHPWFQEILSLSQEEFDNLEEEILQNFLSRELKIKLLKE